MLFKKSEMNLITNQAKICVDKGSEFYYRSMKSWLEQNATQMYSLHNKGKSVVAERFIRTLKNKIYKYMTSISKNVYTVKLDEIVNKNNNTYHRIVIMKPVDVKPSMYIDFNKENNKEGSKFKVGDHGRISKYESIFAKAMLQIGLKKFFLLKTLKTLCCGHVIGDLNREEIVGIIHQKELKKKKKKKSKRV